MVTHQEIFCFWSLISVMNCREDRATTRINDLADHLQKRKRTWYEIRHNKQQGFSSSAECLCHQRMESDTKSRVLEDPTVGNSCLGPFWGMFTLGICSQEAQPRAWPRHAKFLSLKLDVQSLLQSGLISHESTRVDLQASCVSKDGSLLGNLCCLMLL